MVTFLADHPDKCSRELRVTVLLNTHYLIGIQLMRVM